MLLAFEFGGSVIVGEDGSQAAEQREFADWQAVQAEAEEVVGLVRVVDELLQLVQDFVIEDTPEKTETDLTNLLNIDPFVSGPNIADPVVSAANIANNPGRYEPATPATGMLFGPTQAGEDLNPSGQSYSATTGTATSNGNGNCPPFANSIRAFFRSTTP